LGLVGLAAGSVTVAVTDFAFPAALAQLSATLVRDDQIPVQALTVTAGTSTPLPVSAGQYRVFGVATVDSNAGAGSYSVNVEQNSLTLLSSAQSIVAAKGPLQAYAFTSDQLAPGTYSVSLHDFQLPSPLASAKLIAVENGSILGLPLRSPGATDIPVAAGAVTLLVFAQPGTGGSLLDASLSTNSTVVFDQTQPVGSAFSVSKLAVTTPGPYAIAATDLKTPAQFTDFAVYVTQGPNQVALLTNGGKLPSVNLSAGNYFLSVLATPDSSAKAGTYAINVGPGVPKPTVNFSADANNVSSGGTVHLVWTTSDADTCAGTGGGWGGSWAGSEAASNSVSSPAITATTTFTLTCDGAGGEVAKSVTVTVTAPSKGGGGGGSLELATLVVLLGALGAHLITRPSYRRHLA
jgi:hypothetical protein